MLKLKVFIVVLFACLTIATVNASPTGTAGVEPLEPHQPIFKVDSLCDCDTTREYHPICGSDNRLYNNPSVLDCYNKCKKADEPVVTNVRDAPNRRCI